MAHLRGLAGVTISKMASLRIPSVSPTPKMICMLLEFSLEHMKRHLDRNHILETSSNLTVEVDHAADISREAVNGKGIQISAAFDVQHFKQKLYEQ